MSNWKSRADTPRFREVVKDTTPRLIIEYTEMENGAAAMKWGIIGEVPLSLAVSSTVRAQIKLCEMCSGPEHFEECPHSQLVLAWPTLDASIHPDVRRATKNHDTLFFVDYKIPKNSLITMLEVTKSTLLANMLMGEQQRRSQEANTQVQIFTENDQKRLIH